MEQNLKTLSKKYFRFLGKRMYIIINVFNYDKSSGGNSITHYLCHVLNTLTNRKIAYICPVISMPTSGSWHGGVTANGFRCKSMGNKINRKLEEISTKDLQHIITNPEWNTPIISKKKLLRRNNIVIYTEDIPGNPLEQKYVFRWLLYFCMGNTMKMFNKDDILFYFNRSYDIYQDYVQRLNNNIFKSQFIKNYFKIQLFDKVFDIAKNYNKKRKGVCFTIRKSSMYISPKVRETDYPDKNTLKCKNCRKRNKCNGPPSSCKCRGNIDGVRLIHPCKNVTRFEHPTTIEELVEIFNSKKMFYCYDLFCFTPVIASLCGCLTIIVPNKYINVEDLYGDSPWMTYGISYGKNKQNISIAKKQLKTYRKHIYNIFSNINRLNIIHLLRCLKKNIK